MHFQYRLTFKDYLVALSLHARRGVLPFLLNLAVLYIFPICGLCLLVLTLSNPRERFDLGNYIVPAYFLLCPPGVLLLWRAKFKRSQMDSGDCSLDLSDLILVRGHHSKTELEWSAIKSWKEGGKTFLLYLAPGKFIPIPKRICTEQDVIQLRALLQERLAPRPPALT